MFRNKLLYGRRAFVFGLGTLAGAITCTIASRWKQPVANLIQNFEAGIRDFRVVGNTPLRDRASAKGLFYGAASGYQQLSKDPEFANHFARECGILVAEAGLKWKDIQPNPNTFNFQQGDWLARFARDRNMLFRGHTLIWHQALPNWFEEKVNRQNAEQILLKHISTVAGHYAGKMHSWDVVNEAIFPADGRSDGLRKTPWLEFLGPEYINLAFQAAAQADPQAVLVYNENRLDYDTPEMEARRATVLKLLESLKSMKTPVQALGIQGHLFAEEMPFNPKKLRKFLGDVASLGLKILITEHDVTDRKLPSDINVRDRLVAGFYEDYLDVVLDESAVIGVMTWGLSDRYTWLSSYRPRQDGLSVRPLPLDANLNRKLAWNAIARSFDRSLPRR